jgi:hypothetical protein
MHDPEKQELNSDVENTIKDNIGTIVLTSFITGLVVGLTTVIYVTMRDHPRSFPVVMPIQSEPTPSAAPIKNIPKPPQPRITY